MNEKEKPNIGNWDDFAGEWLKVEMIKSFPIELVCIDVEAFFDEDDKAHLILTFDFNLKKKKFEVNKTNQDNLKELGVTSPQYLAYKTITFEKIRVHNPSTKKKVDSLSITKVE